MTTQTAAKLLSVFAVLALSSAAAGEERLRIATDATFPPFHSIDDNGEVTGFDVALARAAGERAGYTVEVVVRDYGELFAGLRDGRHDLIAATTGITAQRQRDYLFTRPYFRTCQAAVVRNAAGEPGRVVDLADRRIGAAGSGTARAAMLATLAGEHRRIRDGEGPELLAANEIDAWIVDEFAAVRVARGSFGRFRVLPDPVAEESYGFVLAAGRHELKERLDTALAELERDGTLGALEREFGVDRDSEWPVEL